jgi:hypothetical protein
MAFKFKPELRENLIEGMTYKLLEAHDQFLQSRSVRVLIGEQEASDIFGSMSSVGPNVGAELEKAVKKIVRIWEDILST